MEHLIVNNTDPTGNYTLKLREPDEIEALAFGYLCGQEALNNSILDSELSYEVLDNESRELIGVFGLKISDNGIGRPYGIPWFVASKKIEKYPIELFKKAKVVMDTMLEVSGGYLTNVTWLEHKESIKLLELLGFQFDNKLISEVPVCNGSESKLDFIRFYKKMK